MHKLNLVRPGTSAYWEWAQSYRVARKLGKLGKVTDLPQPVEVASLPLFGRLASVTKYDDGAVLIHEDHISPFGTAPYAQFRQEMPLIGDLYDYGSFQLERGLTVLSGPPGVGKSTFCAALAAGGRASWHRTGEPFERRFEGVAYHATFDNLLIDAGLASLKSDEGVRRPLIVDSAREPMFQSAGGGYGELGISNAFFIRIALLSNCVARANGSWLLVTNPMYERDTYVEAYKRMVDASAANWIHLTSYRPGEGWTAQVSMRPSRKPRVVFIPEDFELRVVKEQPALVVPPSADEAADEIDDNFIDTTQNTDLSQVRRLLKLGEDE